MPDEAPEDESGVIQELWDADHAGLANVNGKFGYNFIEAWMILRNRTIDQISKEFVPAYAHGCWRCHRLESETCPVRQVCEDGGDRIAWCAGVAAVENEKRSEDSE